MNCRTPCQLTWKERRSDDSVMRAVSNPPNPFESRHREWLVPAPPAKLELYEDSTSQILSRNESPDLPFRWSVNPYRGCFHGCAYCYARPSHQYWGFGAGTDFDSKIIVKRNAPALLRRAFEKPSWKGELIVFSGNTDCYQPMEASLELTRQCLAVCAEYRNPVVVITKGILVLRDLDILKRLQDESWVQVYVSVPFAEDEIARHIEPHAPASRKRFEAMAQLAHAGIPTGISIAPIIPGLNEQDIPELLERARQAGATKAMASLVRLSGPVSDVFFDRLGQAYPERVAKIAHRIKEVRGGALNDSNFFSRHRGEGTYWEVIVRLYEVAARKAGFSPFKEETVPATFRRPCAEQPLLF